MFDLAGKRALVTGASRGTGRAIAKALAAAGATVVMAARDVGALTRAQAEISESGGKVEVCPCDLATLEGCRHLASRCGHIDILVNNAAFTKVKFQSIVVRDDALWSQCVQMHLMAPLTLMQELCPGMATCGGGVVINISSMSAQRGSLNYAHYGTTKAALEAMSKMAALDLASDRIRVVVVALGATDTEALAEACTMLGTSSAGLARELAPNGRLVSVDEVGCLCRYLASEEAASITGTVVTIDNGATAGHYAYADRAPLVHK